MAVATDANVCRQGRSRQGPPSCLYRVGAVMGFTVVGLGLMGVSIMFSLPNLGYEGKDNDATRMRLAADSLAGSGFGASSIALFAPCRWWYLGCRCRCRVGRQGRNGHSRGPSKKPSCHC